MTDRNVDATPGEAMDRSNYQRFLVHDPSCPVDAGLPDQSECNRAARVSGKERPVMVTFRPSVSARFGRRRLVQLAAATLGALGIVAAGASHSFLVRKKPVPPAFAISLATLDGTYASGGLSAIAAFLSPTTGTENDAITVINWIRARQVLAAYGLLVRAMTDSRCVIRETALSKAMRVKPVDLKSFQVDLDAAAASETNARLRTLMRRLADRVRQS